MRPGLRTAAAVLCFGAIPCLVVPAAAKDHNQTIVQIAAVLASNNGRSFDARLSGMRSELKQLRFRSYELVTSETRVLHGTGAQCGVELPNGRYLNITTREHGPDHVRLHILLNEDNRPVVNTYVKLELGSVVLLGGPRDQNGTLVIAIASRPVREGDEEDVRRKPSSSRRAGETASPSLPSTQSASRGGATSPSVSTLVPGASRPTPPVPGGPLSAPGLTAPTLVPESPAGEKH